MLKAKQSAWGERFRHALERRGIAKQLALAHELQVHQSAITRWKESGPISLSNAVNLCALLDVSMDWLLLGRGTIDQHKEAREAGVPEDTGERWQRARRELPAAIAERILDLTDTLVENNRIANLR